MNITKRVYLLVALFVVVAFVVAIGPPPTNVVLAPGLGVRGFG